VSDEIFFARSFRVIKKVGAICARAVGVRQLLRRIRARRAESAYRHGEPERRRIEALAEFGQDELSQRPDDSDS
jgi:hypothetical protein